MLTDPDWQLGDGERSPVLAALAYVCDPEDIIPDDIPGIGLLDDAVMIELVFRELRHEIEAYEDFLRLPQVVAEATRRRSRDRGTLAAKLDAASRSAHGADAASTAAEERLTLRHQVDDLCRARRCAPPRSPRARRSRTPRGPRRRGS